MNLNFTRRRNIKFDSRKNGFYNFTYFIWMRFFLFYFNGQCLRWNMFAVLCRCEIIIFNVYFFLSLDFFSFFFFIQHDIDRYERETAQWLFGMRLCKMLWPNGTPWRVVVLEPSVMGRRVWYWNIVPFRPNVYTTRRGFFVRVLRRKNREPSGTDRTKTACTDARTTNRLNSEYMLRVCVRGAVTFGRNEIS